MRLKKGDEVIITVGKDKGKRGKIEKVNVKEKKVLLPGLNIYKKHVKKQDENHPGGIIDFSRELTVANVAFICPKCHQPTRIGFNLSSGKKRFCRKCDSTL